MKVLHITYTDSGGAGIAAMRIHRSLRDIGVDSHMLVAEKTSNESTVVTADGCFLSDYVPPRNGLLRKFFKIMRKRGYFLSQKEKYERLTRLIPHEHQTMFTSPLSYYNLINHPYVKEADLIHLHWTANFIDYPSFFPFINKPIVWTLHDENLAYGGFHYGRDREQYYQYYASVEDAYCQVKQSSLAQCHNINVVALSKMMKGFYSSQSFLSDRKIDIIHNGIDTNIFRPIDKNVGREVYRISKEKTVIVFCCVNLNDKRKGLDELIDAIGKLNRRDITLICIGTGHIDTDLPIDIIYTGPITNPDLLAMTYSCGDLFAFPSFQEAFAQTPLEAIACGLPIVAFPCSGMEELITSKNGVICENFTSQDLYNGIVKVLNGSFDCKILHEDIERRFCIKKIAADYMSLYKRVLSSQTASI